MKTNLTTLVYTTCINYLSKFRAIALIFLLVFAISLQAQTMHSYATTDATALNADLAAGTYDIYELTTSGGAYVITATRTLSKSTTIRGTGGLASKPVLSFSNSSVTASVSFLKTTATSLVLNFQNLKLSGINGSTGVQAVFLLTQGTNNSIIVKNCDFNNFTNAGPHGIFRMDGTGTSLDIQGSTFDGCTGRLLNFYTPTTTAGFANYGDLTLKNNTFSNTSGATTIVYYRSSGTVATGVNAIIDHCTFYKFTPTNTDGIFVFRAMTGTINVTNCIFDQIGLGFSFLSPAPAIDYCYLGGFATPPTGTHTFSSVPTYTDAANLNFRLSNAGSYICSDAFVAGNTYNSLAVVSISTGANNISKVGFTANWTPVVNAVSYDVYLYSAASLIRTTNVGGQASSSLDIPGLTASTTYTYKVVAKGDGINYFDSALSLESAPITTNDLGTGVSQLDAPNIIKTFGKSIVCSGTGAIEVYNLQGEQLLLRKNTNVVNCELQSGIYLVRFTNIGGRQFVQKISI